MKKNKQKKKKQKKEKEKKNNNRTKKKKKKKKDSSIKKWATEQAATKSGQAFTKQFWNNFFTRFWFQKWFNNQSKIDVFFNQNFVLHQIPELVKSIKTYWVLNILPCSIF